MSARVLAWLVSVGQGSSHGAAKALSITHISAARAFGRMCAHGVVERVNLDGPSRSPLTGGGVAYVWRATGKPLPSSYRAIKPTQPAPDGQAEADEIVTEADRAPLNNMPAAEIVRQAIESRPQLLTAWMPSAPPSSGASHAA